MYDHKIDDIMLCDFGCSEFFHPTSDTLSNTTKGTYLFMAPEMFSADKSTKVIGGRQADIWAAGVTLFNLLTKKYPFQGKNVFELAEKVKNNEPDMTALGPGREQLKLLLKKMLEKDL